LVVRDLEVVLYPSAFYDIVARDLQIDLSTKVLIVTLVPEPRQWSSSFCCPCLGGLFPEHGAVFLYLICSLITSISLVAAEYEDFGCGGGGEDWTSHASILGEFGINGQVPGISRCHVEDWCMFVRSRKIEEG
jgi:hypothetical protein